MGTSTKSRATLMFYHKKKEMRHLAKMEREDENFSKMVKMVWTLEMVKSVKRKSLQSALHRWLSAGYGGTRESGKERS